MSYHITVGRRIKLPIAFGEAYGNPPSPLHFLNLSHVFLLYFAENMTKNERSSYSLLYSSSTVHRVTGRDVKLRFVDIFAKKIYSFLFGILEYGTYTFLLQ
jgi:hypothetical protein